MRVFANGWVEIASEDFEAVPGEKVIVAMSPSPDVPHPYVVAQARDNDTEWYWGNYHRSIGEAVDDFRSR